MSREQPGLSKVIVGLAWGQARSYQSQDIDCNAIVILLGEGRTSTSRNVVFYNHLAHESGAVTHMGDNLTGGVNSSGGCYVATAIYGSYD